jgi:hypothetical protein
MSCVDMISVLQKNFVLGSLKVNYIQVLLIWFQVSTT